MTFGQFCLDLRERKLSRNGVPIELKSKALDILCVLVAARENLVTKDDLMAQVWPRLVVEENNIQVHISALRKALDEGKGGQVHVVTVPGRGYRLIGVQPLPSAASGEGPVAAGLELLDRPSIAVLPFQNMSTDPEQGYFAHGVVEDIIAWPSRTKLLFVIRRVS